MDRLTLAPFMNPRHLQLIILPTEQCNFRCTYCYEDFEIGQMKANTVEAIKRLLTTRIPKLDSLALSWFGGEPLMAKSIVSELSEFAIARCKTAGVSFSGAMTTNAFGLDRGTFDQMLQLEVRNYQISIDGDADEHDKTRKLVNGRGSFERIWNNLLAMRDSQEQFKILLRMHVHTQNVESMKRLVPKVHEAFGSDARFRIMFKPVGDWGGESVKSMDLIKRPAEVSEELNSILREQGWFDVRPPGSDIFNPCYAAKPNSFVIRANGDLNKCTVAFSDPRNRVGQINDDGTLQIDGDRVRSFMRGFKSLEKDALHCPMKGMPKEPEVKVLKFERNAASGAQIEVPA